jgi:16S rRNA (guanine527-N7)-methyltransferase
VSRIGDPPSDALIGVLERARELGFLGPGPIEQQVDHADGFAAVLEELDVDPSAALADLGSGGGVPGLVLLVRRPSARGLLVESMQRRAAFLRRAVAALGLGNRAAVAEERAESVGRSDARGTLDVVVARSFGPPAVVAECAAPLLRVGGLLVVSEPPEDAGPRWPAEGLRRLGLEPGAIADHGFRYHWSRQAALCPDGYPRGIGRPSKRPLF